MIKYGILNLKTREVLVTSSAAWIIDELLRSTFNSLYFTKVKIQ